MPKPLANQPAPGVDPTRRRLCRLLAALPLAALPLRAGAGAALPRGVRDALAQAGIPESACCFIAQDLLQQTPRLAWNAQQAFNPASVLKLVPTYVALNSLGANFHWSTAVYAVGPLAGGVLAGDLGFVGSGDPHLMADDLWRLVLRLHDLGLRRLAGNVLIDRSAFALPPPPPGGFDGDALAPYNVAPDAFLVNLGSMRLSFQPVGDGAAVSVEPPLAGFVAPPPPPLAGSSCGAWKQALQADFSNPLAPRFAGAYAADCGVQTWNLTPQISPDLFVQDLFSALFAEVGIEWHGMVVDGRLPAGATLLTQWESQPLAQIVNEINKFSNNVMAQQLFLTLALQAGQTPADFPKAGAVVTQWLAAHQLEMPGLVLDNGCGLSRDARISGDAVNRLLRAAWAGPLMPEFVASLPLAGEDGTLQQRFAGSRHAGLLHAKTGSLRDVLSLAGYAQDAAGARHSVVALINHPRAEAGWGAIEALLDAVQNPD
jgi:D-alanyl-D-alanine carboxypeptidase/D-alanyl-D-alanine-endopeptidase (penicillin-binding protein 4)